MRRLLFVGSMVLTMVVFGLSCGESLEEELRQSESELRPTDPEDPAGYEGAETDSLVSPEGHVRVFFATEGSHRPPQRDSNSSGVPDYVEMVAEIADEVGEFLEDQGWRRPLSDSLFPSSEPLDLFLVDFSAGDGNYRVEACGAFGAAEVCRGHLRIDNNFEPLYYPSVEYALRVVISHEFFHAVQAAYQRLPPWWSEGTATWFQEHFWAEQSDFERLTGPYFDDHERSLHDRQRGAFDSFAYGASIFAYFLEQQFGAQVIQEIFEAMGEGLDTIEGLETVLAEEGTSLSETFELFAAWNVFTGSRAVEGQGYPEAERFDEIRAIDIDADRGVDWNVAVDPLAVKYARIDGGRDVSLRAEERDDFAPASLQVVSPGEFAESGAVVVVGEEWVLFRAEELPIYVVVANGDVDEEGAVQVQLRGGDVGGEAEEELIEEVDEDRSGGCATVPGSGKSGSSGWYVLAFLIVLGRREARS